MKNSILKIILLLSVFSLQAQNVELKDLKNLNSPGFQILDIAPNTIDRPANPKAFAASLMSLTSSGTALPQNFALEIAPYWYFKPKNATVSQYLNIKEGDKSNTTTGIFNKLSFSLASVSSDSTSGSLIKNTNYIAFGIKTNIISYRTEKQNKKLQDALANYSKRTIQLRPNEKSIDTLEVQRKKAQREIKDLFKKLNNETNDSIKKAINKEYINVIKREALIDKQIEDFENQSPDLLENNMKNDTLIQNYLKELDDLPLIQVDAAFAYSEAFPDNQTQNKRFNRSGLWLNAAVNAFSTKELTGRDGILTFMLCARFISDNKLQENSLDLFERQNVFDLGFKLEYSFEGFSISYEYLKRDYSNDSSSNSERKVGSLEFKISDGLYLTGAYGNNFGNGNNLFTLFGINYGFGKSSLKIK